MASLPQEIKRRPTSLAKRALLKRKEKTSEETADQKLEMIEKPALPIDNKAPIVVEATVDARLKALKDPKIMMMLQEQGVTPKELIEMSDAIMKGEYNPYDRDFEARREKTSAIKAAKKEARLQQQTTPETSEPKPVAKPPRNPNGLSSPAPHRSAETAKNFNQPFISESLVNLPPPGDYQRWPTADRPKVENESLSASDAALLHGVTLKDMLSYLIENVGFPTLYRETNARCFHMEPSLISSLKCLRANSMSWARQKIEALYVGHKRRHMEMDTPL